MTSDAPQTSMLKLRDGRILWGSVTSHDAELVTFERLDTGGVVRLPWDFIDPDVSRQMQLEHGYIEPAGEEILVTADSIPIHGGENVIGHITKRTDEALWVQTAGGTLPIPLQRISGASTRVQVPALEVYTRDQLYNEQLTLLGVRLAQEGEPGAEAHFELGDFCERILDFQNALAHYEVGAQLAPQLRANEVASILGRLTEKAANQEQWEYLKDADLLRARRYYARALEKLDVFPQLYPDSPVMGDWERLKSKALKGQERALREEIVRRWYFHAQRHAQRAARELPFEETVAWIEGPMGEEIAASVLEDVTRIAPDLSEETVRALWEEREGGRVQTASYGLGTWLLGEDRARAMDSDDEDEEAEANDPKDELRDDLRQRMKRYVDAQRRSARRQQQGGGEDPQAFWERSSVSARRLWIMAYYAEFSGDMRVVRTRLANCRECGGTGAKEVIYLGSAKTRDAGSTGKSSGHRLTECPTCHRTGVVRRVQYR